jgi:hypothetical protein
MIEEAGEHLPPSSSYVYAWKPDLDVSIDEFVKKVRAVPETNFLAHFSSVPLLPEVQTVYDSG